MDLGRLLHGQGNPSTPGVTIGPARAYEVISALGFAGRRRAVFSRLVALSGAKPGDRAVDVGCGTGYLTRMLAEAVTPGGVVVGIDPSPSVIGYAERVTTNGACAYQLGIAEELELPDASTDVVVSSLMIHHLPQRLRARAFEEMFRVLRPGGGLLVADFRPPTGRLGRRLVGLAAGPAMRDNPVHLLESLAGGAGFVVEDSGDVRPLLHYVRATRP